METKGRVTYDVCGIPIAALEPHAAAQVIVAGCRKGQGLQVHLCNAYTLSLVGRDTRLRAALLSADLNLADGSPVAWLGRRVGVKEPTRGPQLLRGVVGAGQQFGIRHYFYGGAPGVADALATRLQQDYPQAEVAGAFSPPYGDPSDEDLLRLARTLEETRADIVWIGLGTPRQDYVVPRIGQIAKDVHVVPVGAAFDFLTGRVAEAPAILHGSGLEWIYRLAREPRRLGRRYLIGNPRFVRDAIRSRKRASL